MDHQTTSHNPHAEYERMMREQKKKIRKRALLISIIAAVCIIGFIAVVSIISFSVLKGSDAYHIAEEYIKNDTEVQEQTGGIKDFGLIPAGHISTVNGYGTADLTLSVNGNEQDIDVYIHLEKDGGEWEVLEMEIIE